MGVEEDGNFLGTDWDPLLLVNQSMDFNGSVGLSSYNVGVTGSQGMISSSTGRIEQMPRPSYLGSDRFSEAMSSVPLSSSNHSSSAQCPPDFPTTGEHSIEKNLKTKKRKGSPLERIQNNEAEEQKNASSEALKSPIEKDEKLQKTELNPGANSKKPTAKHSKEDSQNCDTAKEDYIHMRAKRGQATNSHSLAERVRREKISERMRVLQDLVPGCNKITGKAVMLDEIINYVQSLQRQVEFLSMKLAAINPELNFDVEQILSKDVFYIREGSSTVLGFSPPMTNPNPQFHDPSPHGLMQPEMLMSTMPNPGDMFRAPTPHISSMAHISNVWGHELQNIVPMNFIPNPPLDTKEATGKYVSKEATGSMKVEL